MRPSCPAGSSIGRLPPPALFAAQSVRETPLTENPQFSTVQSNEGSEMSFDGGISPLRSAVKTLTASLYGLRNHERSGLARAKASRRGAPLQGAAHSLLTKLNGGPLDGKAVEYSPNQDAGAGRPVLLLRPADVGSGAGSCRAGNLPGTCLAEVSPLYGRALAPPLRRRCQRAHEHRRCLLVLQHKAASQEGATLPGRPSSTSPREDGKWEMAGRAPERHQQLCRSLFE